MALQLSLLPTCRLFLMHGTKGVEVHISTQCNITNIEAVKYYSQFADVIVTARELNLNRLPE